MNQDYIDFLNNQKSDFETQISALQSQKISIEEQKVQSEYAIAAYEAQKDQADADIVRLTDNIAKFEDIISILQAQN